jgi:hypothetical protein
MGHPQGSRICDPEFREQSFTSGERRDAGRPSSRLPFQIKEAMVNHKKMVHPPSCG